MIRFDGLYVGPPKTSGNDPTPFYDYLRFYADGWVINCVSLGTPEQVIRWFYRENPAQLSLLKGRYEIRGDEISFSPEFTDYDEGEIIVLRVDYRGRIMDGGASLHLEIGNSSNGYSSTGTYRFAEVAASLPEDE